MNKFIHKRVLFLLLVVFSLFLVFLLIEVFQIINPTPKEIYNDVKYLYNNWENRRAEKQAYNLYEKNPGDLKINCLYGDILLRLRELNKAKKFFSFIVASDHTKKIEALLKLAEIYYYQNNLDTARNILKTVDSLALIKQDSLSIARSFHLKGKIEFNSLSYKNAMNFQKRSFDLAVKLKNIGLQADALRQIGVLYWYNSQPDSALNCFYVPALELYRKVNDKAGEATTLSNIGLIYREQSKPELNVDYQLRAFAIRKQIGDKIGLADSYYFLSKAVSLTGWNGTLVYSYLKKSFDISESIGYKWGMEVANRSLILDFEYFNFPGGFSAANLFTEDSLLYNTGEGKIFALFYKFKMNEEKGDRETAEILEQIVNLWDSLGVKNGEQFQLIRLASALISLKEYNRAEALLKKARESSRKDPYSKFMHDTTLAKLYIKKGQLEEAKKVLVSLISSYDTLYTRGLFAETREAGSSFLVDKMGAAYSMLIDVLYKQNDPGLFYYVQKERALSKRLLVLRRKVFNDFRDVENRPDENFIEMLNRYEQNPELFNNVQPLIDKFENEQGRFEKICNTISDFSKNEKHYLNAEPVASPKDLQTVLQNGEVLVEYFVGTDSLFVLVVRKDSFAIIKLNVTRKELNSLVILYNEVIERGAKYPEDNLWKNISCRLCTLLIEPVVQGGFLERGDHVIISPHKILHILPFQTLCFENEKIVNSKSGTKKTEFLIERNTISYTPSSSYFVNNRMNKLGKRFYNSLVAIVPDEYSLPEAGNEVGGIPKSHFMKYTLLRNGDAEKDRVLRSLRNFDVVHIASHAVMNQWFPLYSSIRCSNENIKLYEILGAKLNSKLVILSACETGLSVSSNGGFPENEDILSFSRAFLYGGANTVIASLWIVNDKSTAELMRLFYQNMFRQNNSIVNSLNFAQRSFIDQKRDDGESIHPFYWGAFFVSGDER